jgi:hypothetical protein
MPSRYQCPVCGVEDETAYIRCQRPNCLDGRDSYGRTRPANEARPPRQSQRRPATVDVLTLADLNPPTTRRDGIRWVFFWLGVAFGMVVPWLFHR